VRIYTVYRIIPPEDESRGIFFMTKAERQKELEAGIAEYQSSGQKR